MKTDHLGQRWNPKKIRAHRRTRPVVHPSKNIVVQTWTETQARDGKGNLLFRENGLPRMVKSKVLTLKK